MPHNIYGRDLSIDHWKEMSTNVRHVRDMEKAYRRGYDQAVYFVLSRLISDYEKEKRSISFAERVSKWRSQVGTYKTLNTPPPMPTVAEIDQLRDLIKE